VDQFILHVPFNSLVGPQISLDVFLPNIMAMNGASNVTSSGRAFVSWVGSPYLVSEFSGLGSQCCFGGCVSDCYGILRDCRFRRALLGSYSPYVDS
jgi:hypothetical protein